MKTEASRSVSWFAACAGGVLLCTLQAWAEAAADAYHEVRVAVAANFSATADRLCSEYFLQRPGRCVLTPGASGLLASQVAQGAPFDVFLSADRQRAERLEAEGLAVPGTRYTYAVGRLVLWLPGWNGGADLHAALTGGAVRTLAIANPDTAPYGVAALETLRELGLEPRERWRIVQGENVAQAFQFIASGAADAGFVALSQVVDYEAASGKSLSHEIIAVDPDLHAPIEQQAVLLATAATNADARGLLDYLRSVAAARIITAAGYDVPQR